jgi:acetylornithine deacetylase/succinyl-diaminopimelate desuccinylase-like protein
MGGSDPDYYFTRLLGIPRVNVPYAPHDENNHAPNESTKVSLYLAGIRSGLHLIEKMGTVPVLS